MRTKGILMAAFLAAVAFPMAAMACDQQGDSSKSTASASASKDSEACKLKKEEMARKFLAVLKERNPAKYEELMKLRETDKEAFRAEIKRMIKEYVQKRKEQKSSGGSGGASASFGKPIDIKS